MTKRRIPPYVAVGRSMFDHPLWAKDRKKPWPWQEAWRWLFTNAAWKPSGQRGARGVADTRRGQIAVTMRGLAKRFNWPVGSVQYFIRRLVEDGMVEKSVANTKINTRSGPRSSYRVTVLTICNYEKWQPEPRRDESSGVQSLIQDLNQRSPQLPGLVYEIAPKPTKQLNQSKEKNPASERDVWRPRPPHRKPWNGLIFLHHETEDWRLLAQDFAEVRGTALLPRRYRDGYGNWFVVAGEANREPWQASR